MKKILFLMIACFCVSMVSAQKYTPVQNRLNKSFTVKGGVGIEQFVRAVGIYEHDETADFVMDKANGYFHVSQEGAGGCSYTASYWNRKDGKKLFIVTYRVVDELYQSNADRDTYASPWFYSSIEKDSDSGTELRCEIGFRAYLYNASTQQLVPLSDVPVSGWMQEKTYRRLDLPRKGKDITVYQGSPFQSTPSYTLKWNGTSFQMGGAGASTPKRLPTPLLITLY